MKVFTPPGINHLSGRFSTEAVCCRPCSCVQQTFEYPISYQAESSKVSSSSKTLYQNDSLKKEIHKRLVAKADVLEEKILSCLRTKLSNSHILILVCVETGGWFFVRLCSTISSQQRRRSRL